MSTYELCSEILRIKYMRYPKYDVAIKTLFAIHNSGLRRLFGLRDESIPLSEEFGQLSSRRADAVILHNNVIHHFEFQTKNDDRMHLRMLEYVYLIMSRHNNENVRQVVLYIGNEALDMRESIRSKLLNYSYNLVDLKLRIDLYDVLINSKIIEDNIAGLLCEPMCSTQDWVEVLRKIDDLENDRKADAVTLLIIVTLIRPADKKILKRINGMAAVINVENSRVFRDIYDKGEDVGLIAEAVRAALDICEIKNIFLDQERKKMIADLNLEELRSFRRFVFSSDFEEAMILVQNASHDQRYS